MTHAASRREADRPDAVAPPPVRDRRAAPAWRRPAGWALLTGAVLLAARVIPWGLNPYSPCTFLRVTGIPCPLCGSTRTFAAMAHGAWADAFANSPFAAVLFLALVGFFAWNAAAAVPLALGRTAPRWPVRMRPRAWMFIPLGAMLLANWVYRIAAGLR